MEKLNEEKTLENTGQTGLFRNVGSVIAGLFVPILLATVAFTLIALNFPKEYRLPAGGNPPVWIIQTYTIVLLVASLLAGFVTAKVSKLFGNRNLMILAFIWAVFYLFLWRGRENPFIFEVVRSLIQAGLVILGGHLYFYRQKYRRGFSV